MNTVSSAVVNGNLMPHGYCLLWYPDLLWLHVASDLLISLAYFTIPTILFYFVRKRRETPFPGLILLFAAFILSCGATHVLETLTIWYPLYRLEGYVKLFTGMVSMLTALTLFPILPKALALRSPRELEAANQALASEVEIRRHAEQKLAEARDRLEERVAERTASLRTTNDQLLFEISEREQAEAALVAEKERALVTLRSIADGVIVTDPEGVIELLNPVAEFLTGHTGDSVVGQSITTVLCLQDEVDRTPRGEELVDCLRDGEPRKVDNLILVGREQQEYTVVTRAAPIRHHDDRITGMVVTFHDVTEARRLVREMEFQAHHDPLTELPNRRELEQRLDRLLDSVKTRNTQHSLCYLDLDRFKLVNDTVGHQAGDQLLREITGLFRSTIRARDTLARVGGDEFCLLLENCPLDRATDLARELVKRVEQLCFVWDDQEFHVGVSIGLTPLLAEDDHEGLLARADSACYRAKEAGRGQVHVSIPGDDLDATQGLNAASLHRLLESNHITLSSHPIYALAPEVAVSRHYGVRARLITSNGQIIDHHNLLASAGHYRLTSELSQRLLTEGLRQAQALLTTEDQAWVAIPLATQALSSAELPGLIARSLAETRLRPSRLCLSLDEPTNAHEHRVLETFLAQMQDSGCRFMLSGFGRHRGSLNRLAQLPVDYLSFDASLARRLREPVVLKMIAAVVEICKLLNITTIASGADTIDIVERLQALDVQYAEGEVFTV